MASQRARTLRRAAMTQIRVLSFAKDQFWLLAITVIALRALSGPTGLVAYILIAAWGVRGGRHVLEALILSWFVTMANSTVFGDVAGGALGRYLVLFTVSLMALARYVATYSFRVNFATLTTLILGGYILLHSLLFSIVMPISVLKGLLWTMTVLAVLLSTSSLSQNEFVRLERHIYGFLVLILALSILVYLTLPGGSLPHYGYLRGMLGHSQATGVLGALVAVWAFARILRSSNGGSWNYAVVLMALAGVYLSATRTGLVSAIIAFVLLGVLAALKGYQPLINLTKGLRNPVVLLGVCLLFLGAVLNVDALTSSFSNFMTKNAEENNLIGAYGLSRGDLIGEMWENIVRDPWVGLGFGIASDPESMVVQRVGGIPIGAVVEKGITHIAIWEEIGLIGLALAIIWIVTIFSKSVRSTLVQFGLLVVIFLQNFGEATLFSVGGMGLLQIILIGYCSYSRPVNMASHIQSTMLSQDRALKYSQKLNS